MESSWEQLLNTDYELNILQDDTDDESLVEEMQTIEQNEAPSFSYAQINPLKGLRFHFSYIPDYYYFCL